MKKYSTQIQEKILKEAEIILLVGPKTFDGQIKARKKALNYCFKSMQKQTIYTHGTMVLNTAKEHIDVICRLYKLNNSIPDLLYNKAAI